MTLHAHIIVQRTYYSVWSGLANTVKLRCARCNVIEYIDGDKEGNDHHHLEADGALSHFFEFHLGECEVSFDVPNHALPKTGPIASVEVSRMARQEPPASIKLSSTIIMRCIIVVLVIG